MAFTTRTGSYGDQCGTRQRADGGSIDRRDRSRAEGGTHTNTDAIGDKTMIMIAPSARRSFANALASRALPLQSDDDVLRLAVAPS